MRSDLFIHIRLECMLRSMDKIKASTESKSPVDFINDLISEMTIDEKIGQMTQYDATWDVTGPPTHSDSEFKYEEIALGRVGSMLNILGTEATREAQRIAVEQSRLGIPLLFGYDVVHGYKTMFPIPLADAASWDMQVCKTASRIAATEASAAGINWVFAPMMDVTRDARWGRIMEGGGEDPYLGSKIAVARIQGLQGNSLSDPNTVAATAKHFAGYGFVEGGLEYNTIQLNRNTLLNQVFPPFKASVDAGVATIMNSFNDVDGIPMVANAKHQQHFLREEWGFDGVIISDYSTISELIIHQYAKDRRECALRAFKASTDVDMESQVFRDELKNLLKDGLISEAEINESVQRILNLKYKLGLFDDPYRYSDEQREKVSIGCVDYLEKARDAAKRSVVLLKNESDLLPLAKDASSIAVIGALASDKDTPLGSWRAQADSNTAVSLLEGISEKVSPDTKLVFAEGYTLARGKREFTQKLDFSNADNTSGFEEAIEAAKSSDVTIVAVGEECFQSGEGRSQTDIGLKGAQLQLLKELRKVTDNIVAVLMNGRPIAESWLYDNIPSILECWHLGSQAGHGIADVLFGDYNPSGKLPVSIPRNVGQIPIAYNQNSCGRPTAIDGDPNFVFWSHYEDSEKTAQYYFGHGLSYTTFEYSDFSLSSTEMGYRDEIVASIKITNTGKFDGEEVVQLYINDMYSSTIRPVKELKGFEKIHLAAGESRVVSFKIDWETLAFYGEDEEFKAEPGEFEIMVGGNSTDLLKASLLLK